jgi:DNA-binding NarL/FixJ family response regulator
VVNGEAGEGSSGSVVNGGEGAVSSGVAVNSEADTAGSGVAVMVVDDHPLWRDAVARDLAEAGFRVVATAGDGDEAVRRARAARPRVMVLDLHLPGLSGAEVCRAAVADNPALRVLVLSASGEHADVLEAVRSGATGYLVKSAGRDELVAAVRRTAEGEPVFTPGLAGLVLGEFRRLATEPPPPAARGRQPEPEAPRLTERETEVLRLVAKGLTYRQIAERLVISHRTVQNHVQNTLGKLQLHNRVELVRYAIASGLDDPADAAGPDRSAGPDRAGGAAPGA